MNDAIRRWAQFAVGVGLIVYALKFEHDPSYRLTLATIGGVLIDPEHVLSAITAKFGRQS